MNPTTIGTDLAGNQCSRGEHDMALMCEYMVHAMKKSSQQRMLSRLPPQARKKICALRKIQLETTHLEAEFHRMVYDLEKKHQEKHEILFEKRKNIINGKYDPTEDECDFPEPVSDPTIQFLNMNDSEDKNNIDQRGVPNFWLSILKYVPMFDSMVKEIDEPLLQHLEDIRVTIEPLPGMSFTLEFVFSPNDYFENTVLTKAYIMKCEPEIDTPFTFDGPEIYKSKGCQIRWKEGKNLTQQLVKQKNPENGQTKIISSETFFNFFNPPELPAEENDKDYDEINAALETDFEVGHYLKERIIPRAILYFTGENDDDFESDASTFSSDGSEVEDEVNEEHQGDSNYSRM